MKILETIVTHRRNRRFENKNPRPVYFVNSSIKLFGIQVYSGVLAGFTYEPSSDGSHFSIVKAVREPESLTIPQVAHSEAEARKMLLDVSLAYAQGVKREREEFGVRTIVLTESE